MIFSFCNLFSLGYEITYYLRGNKDETMDEKYIISNRLSI
jgi:hypothetical protein